MNRHADPHVPVHYGRVDAHLSRSDSIASGEFQPDAGIAVADSSAGLAGSPAAVVIVWIGWSLLGVLVADRLARRGHDRRTMTALGLALGPFMIAVAFGSARRRAASAVPIVLDRGADTRGSRMMIGLGGDAEAIADVEPVLRLVGDEIGHIDLVVRIAIEDGTPDVGNGRRHSDAAVTARRTLHGAAALLGDRRPGLVLVPGPPQSAIADYAVDHDYDLVAMTGTAREREAFARAHADRGGPPVFLSPGRLDPRTSLQGLQA